MNRDNLKNNLNEQENLSADEQKISRLIGGLEQVSAPKDFDFRLKARISAAQENNFQPSIWKTLRYALPLTATLVIAAFVMIQAGLFSQTDNQPTIAENPKQENPVNSQSPPSNQQITQTSNLTVDETIPDAYAGESNSTQFIAVKNPVGKPNKNKPEIIQNDDSPRSKDFTVRPSNVQITPEGIPGNTALVNKEFNNNISIPAQEILNMLGVETEADGNKLKVKSVKENSLAERSGVRTGDIVEAIDEQRLDEKNLSPKFKGGKKITVTRDDKVVEIELKPN
jgi:hypothetical protein